MELTLGDQFAVHPHALALRNTQGVAAVVGLEEGVMRGYGAVTRKSDVRLDRRADDRTLVLQPLTSAATSTGQKDYDRLSRVVVLGMGMVSGHSR